MRWVNNGMKDAGECEGGGRRIVEIVNGVGVVVVNEGISASLRLESRVRGGGGNRFGEWRKGEIAHRCHRQQPLKGRYGRRRHPNIFRLVPCVQKAKLATDCKQAGRLFWNDVRDSSMLIYKCGASHVTANVMCMACAAVGDGSR